MAPKKTAAKKTSTKETAAKKTSTKKTATKKAAAKKTTAKKTTAKKTAAKKTTAKKTAAKKTSTKKAATKKTAMNKAPTKKTTLSTTKPAPLATRLGVLGGPFHIDNPPHGFELLVPPGVEIGIDLPEKLGTNDAALAFVQDVSQVEYLAQRLKKALPKPSIDAEVQLWVAYSTSRRSEVTANKGWDKLTAMKLVKTDEVEVEAGWVAARFRHASKV